MLLCSTQVAVLQVPDQHLVPRAAISLNFIRAPLIRFPIASPWRHRGIIISPNGLRLFVVGNVPINSQIFQAIVIRMTTPMAIFGICSHTRPWSTFRIEIMMVAALFLVNPINLLMALGRPGAILLHVIDLIIVIVIILPIVFL